MNLQVIENKPLFKHTISDTETTFIASCDGKDFYYRYNGIAHIIDVRYSNTDSDYTNWTIVNYQDQLVQSEFMDSVIPKWIQFKAIEMINVSF